MNSRYLAYSVSFTDLINAKRSGMHTVTRPAALRHILYTTISCIILSCNSGRIIARYYLVKHCWRSCPAGPPRVHSRLYLTSNCCDELDGHTEAFRRILVARRLAPLANPAQKTASDDATPIRTHSRNSAGAGSPDQGKDRSRSLVLAHMHHHAGATTPGSYPPPTP